MCSLFNTRFNLSCGHWNCLLFLMERPFSLNIGFFKPLDFLGIKWQKQKQMIYQQLKLPQNSSQRNFIFLLFVSDKWTYNDKLWDVFGQCYMLLASQDILKIFVACCVQVSQCHSFICRLCRMILILEKIYGMHSDAHVYLKIHYYF